MHILQFMLDRYTAAQEIQYAQSMLVFVIKV